MEKKTKKLQLRKETIAVLNGERMSHVVGGTGIQPDPNNPTGYIVDTIRYVCQTDLVFNPAMTICDLTVNMGTSLNGEICQDTVASVSKCCPTNEGKYSCLNCK